MRFVLKSDRGNYYSGPDPHDDHEPYFTSEDVSKAVVFGMTVGGGTAEFTPPLPRGKWAVVPILISIREQA
jgi:hypothetical protein